MCILGWIAAGNTDRLYTGCEFIGTCDGREKAIEQPGYVMGRRQK